MSAMAAKVRGPEGLYEPPEYTPELAHKLMEHLSPESGQLFWREIMDAILKARATDDLRPINIVVETWFRTLLFQIRPKFDQKWQEMEATDGPRLSLDDIRRRRAQRTA